VQTKKSIGKNNAYITYNLKHDISEKLSLLLQTEGSLPYIKERATIQNQMNPFHILAPYYFMNIFNTRPFFPNSPLVYFFRLIFYKLFHMFHARISQSVQGLATGWKAEGSEFAFRYGQEFSLLHVVQTDSGSHPASYPMGIGDFSPGG
jgi:hypothetical protein